MRCAILDEAREPLRLAEIDDLVPGDEELLLRVEACGACHSDLHIVDGDWEGELQRRVRPTILGHEIVGTVVARGAAAGRFEPGTRVGVGWVGETCGTCEPCATGDDNLCDRRRTTGVDRPGGWATHARVHAPQAVLVPAGLDPVDVAPLFCAGVTVYRSMTRVGIGAGDQVAVFGIGGLGHLAVQLARLQGADVVAVDPGEAQRELALELGATLAVPADGAPASIAARGGASVAVVTAASARVYREAFMSLRRGGTLVIVGLPTERLSFSADEIAMKEARITGSVVGTREDTRKVLALALEGKLRCVTESVPLDRVNEALDRLRRGAVRGRLVIVP